MFYKFLQLLEKFIEKYYQNRENVLYEHWGTRAIKQFC